MYATSLYGQFELEVRNFDEPKVSRLFFVIRPSGSLRMLMLFSNGCLPKFSMWMIIGARLTFPSQRQ